MISLFVDKESDAATMQLYEILQKLDLPEDVHITINNLEGAESGVLHSEVGTAYAKQDAYPVDISLAHCYSLEDVVRELVKLMVR